MSESEGLIPHKTEAYLFAQSVFFIQFNDVEFYVEDIEQESLYFRILSRVFPAIRIERIFSLGGKRAVLEHALLCKSPGKSIYILDRDFDGLLLTTNGTENIIYLEKYCIENYLLETTAIGRFIVSEKPTLTEAKVHAAFAVEEFINTSIAGLRFLFLLYFIIQKHAIPDMKNASLPVARFVKGNDRASIDPAKVEEFKKEIVDIATVLGLDLEAEIAVWRETFELHKEHSLSGEHISGKYLLGLLLAQIVNNFDCPGTDLNSGRYRLAEYCVFDSLNWMKDRVNAILKVA